MNFYSVNKEVSSCDLLNWLASSSPSDWISSGAAIVVACAAVKGLKSWQTYIGQKKYDAASELKAAVFRFRESIKSLRNPLRHNTDYSKNPYVGDPSKPLNVERKRYFDERDVLQTRSAKVTDAVKKFNEAIFKAEVALGDEVRGLDSGLMTILEDIMGAWGYYTAELHRATLTSGIVQIPVQFNITKEYPHEATVGDEFDEDLDAEVSKIQDVLEKYLH
jgi:hypothetical protein